MNKIVAITLAILLCVASFAAGHTVAMRKAASIVLDNAKAIAIWRESDWAVSSIHYAKMIQLVQARQYEATVDQACQGIAKDLKNLREIARTNDRASSKPRIPASSEQTYATYCK